MKQLLQNHPNFHDYPIKSWKVLSKNLRERTKIIPPLFILLLTSSRIGIITLTTLMISFLITPSLLKESNSDLTTYLSIGGLTLIFLITFILLLYQLINTPKREQLRYYQQANLTTLPVEKRQALRLCSISDYCEGFWTETLEHYPLQSRVTHDNYNYRLLYLSKATEHQSQLYQDWGIVDKENYTRMIEELWHGMHSKLFLESMTEHEPTEMIKVLSNLVEISPNYLFDCLNSHNTHPPALLWGFDLWRAIILSRNCFCANIISEQQAWQDILKTASYVYEIFDSFDAFITNYQLGNAYWCNNFDMIKNKIKQYNYYQKYCDWPIKNLPWPTHHNIPLPQYMRTAFGKYTPSKKIHLCYNADTHQ